MNDTNVLYTSPWMCSVIERIKEKQSQIHNWLKNQEDSLGSLLYSSVDIRDAAR